MTPFNHITGLEYTQEELAEFNSCKTYDQLNAYVKMAWKRQGVDWKTVDEQDEELRQHIKNGTMTVNQIRQQYGREPIYGGDVSVQEYRMIQSDQSGSTAPRDTCQPK